METDNLGIEELREQLFNVEVKDDNLLRRLIQIGQKRDLPISEVANEWMSFSSSKHLQLNYHNIENFSLWLSSQKQKAASTFTQATPPPTQRYTKDKLHSLFSSRGRDDNDDDDDYDTVLNTYKSGGGGRGGVKREAPSTPLCIPDSKNRQYSLSSTLHNEDSPSLIMCRMDTPTTRDGIDTIQCSSGLSEMKRFMYQPPSHKRAILAQRIMSLGDKICQKIGINDISDTSLLTQPTTEVSVFIGCVACDGEGRLNAHSCLLEGVESYHQEILKHRLVRVTLDLRNNLQTPCSLFPGQVIAVEGTLHSNVLTPIKIYDCGVFPARNPLRTNAGGRDISAVVAAGPFTLTDSLDLSPLTDLLRIVELEKPNLLILVGPFIEHTHVSLKEGKQFVEYDSFETYFVTKILKPVHVTCLESKTRVLIVPAQNDICHSMMIYPQPPYPLIDEIRNDVGNVISMLPDPSTVTFNNVNIGISSVDILFHLSSSSLSIGPGSGDRMARLLSHILQQQCYYPLYPPYLKEDTVTKATSTMETTGSYIENLPEVNLDVALAYGDSETAGHANLNILPDLLVLPSKLKPFVKVINGCLCVNPGYLGRKGTFTKLTAAVSTDGKDVDKSAQIIHI